MEFTDKNLLQPTCRKQLVASAFRDSLHVSWSQLLITAVELFWEQDEWLSPPSPWALHWALHLGYFLVPDTTWCDFAAALLRHRALIWLAAAAATKGSHRMVDVPPVRDFKSCQKLAWKWYLHLTDVKTTIFGDPRNRHGCNLSPLKVHCELRHSHLIGWCKKIKFLIPASIFDMRFQSGKTQLHDFC